MNYRFLSDDIAISTPADAVPIYTKPGCPLEGMMAYDGEMNRLNIKKGIFERLNTPTDTAASWMHEAIYKYFRDQLHQTTSTNARRLTACLFSRNLNCVSKIYYAETTPPPGAQVFNCQSARIGLRAYMLSPNVDGTAYFWRLLVTRISPLGQNESFGIPLTATVLTQINSDTYGTQLLSPFSELGYSTGINYIETSGGSAETPPDIRGIGLSTDPDGGYDIGKLNCVRE